MQDVKCRTVSKVHGKNYGKRIKNKGFDIYGHKATYSMFVAEDKCMLSLTEEGSWVIFLLTLLL